MCVIFCVDEMRMKLLNQLRTSGKIEVTLP